MIGRNCEPWAAGQVLDLGRTDAGCMARALRVIPSFPIGPGGPGGVRPCIGCTDCITHVHGMIRCSMIPMQKRLSR